MSVIPPPPKGEYLTAEQILEIDRVAEERRRREARAIPLPPSSIERIYPEGEDGESEEG